MVNTLLPRDSIAIRDFTIIHTATLANIAIVCMFRGVGGNNEID